MFEISVKANPDLEKFPEIIALEEKKVTTAAIRAANKTARWLRFTVAREVAQELDIKVGLVKDTLTLQKASVRRMQSRVAVYRHKGVIPAIDLGGATQTSTGVRIKKRHLKSAFIAQMKSGHVGVFNVDQDEAEARGKRKWGDPQLPIFERKIVVTGRLAKALEKMENGIGIKQFEKIFERELRHVRKSK